jgi:hypothetical protein
LEILNNATLSDVRFSTGLHRGCHVIVSGSMVYTYKAI